MWPAVLLCQYVFQEKSGEDNTSDYSGWNYSDDVLNDPLVKEIKTYDRSFDVEEFLAECCAEVPTRPMTKEE